MTDNIMENKIIDYISKILPYTTTNLIIRYIGEGLILDICCGDGSQIMRIGKRKNHTIIGIDIFKPAIKDAKTKAIYDDLIIGDIRFLPIKNKKFDSIIFLEGLEHISKNEGFILLNTLENISMNRIIITTPVGFIEQNEYNENPFQLHKSYWLPIEFKEKGYKIYPTEFKYPVSSSYPFSFIKMFIRLLLTPFFYPLMIMNPTKFCSRAVYIKEINEKKSD